MGAHVAAGRGEDRFSRRITGKYYPVLPGFSVSAAIALASNQSIGIPLWLPDASVIDRLAVVLAAGGVGATTRGRMGLYYMDPATGLPGALMADYGLMNFSAVDTIESATLPTLVSPGWVTVALWAEQMSVSQPSSIGWAFRSIIPVSILGMFAPPGGYDQANVGVYKNGIAAAGGLPNPFGAAPGYLSSAPMLCFRQG